MRGIVEEPVSERHVQAAWFDSSVRPEQLRTVRGCPVRVVDPGEWNLEAGPDFLGAVLEIGAEGRRLAGDVEVHLRPSDWNAHGHGGDPAYSHVVAHVTWRSGRFPNHEEDGLPPGCVSICIGDFLRARPGFSPAEIDVTAYPYASLPCSPRPCQKIFGADPDLALWTICEAGRRRLRQKAGRISVRLLRSSSREQTFYEECFSALGYKYNSFPFREVARAVPWNSVPYDADAAYTCYSCAASMRATDESAWRLANVRPVNSPERRLAAAARIFSGGSVLMERLLACDFLTREGSRAALRMLAIPGWLGMHRAAAILANVVVPFALAEGRLKSVPDWLCPEDVSSPVRLTARRMLGRDHNPALYSGNGLLIQGLIQIHHEFCLAARIDCTSCRLVSERT